VRRQQGKSDAEPYKKYFCTIKFSTQLLISVWKIWSRQELTSLSSTVCSGLHNFSATEFFFELFTTAAHPLHKQIF